MENPKGHLITRSALTNTFGGIVGLICFGALKPMPWFELVLTGTADVESVT